MHEVGQILSKQATEIQYLQTRKKTETYPIIKCLYADNASNPRNTLIFIP